MRPLRRHAPLVAVLTIAAVATVLMPVFAHPFVYGLAASLWGLVVLMAVLDVTPREAQEKEES